MKTPPKELSPSEFYRKLRPEYFSDSTISREYELPKEVFAYELENISTNQKQDEFETFTRRLVEKTIAPNLIPQVGPTGGGDGKTDSETHLVSKSISSRWFIPENGWAKDEKWAFAISSKEDWRGKLREDIKSILSTEREYSQIFFITNRKISSKKKKDVQDLFSSEFEIEITILDGEWIIEKVYNNDFIDLAVDSLNLSSSFKSQITSGPNDVEREKSLQDLEAKIQNPNSYLEYDFQLVEDCLEAAILSRMLEKPRDEVEGKFDRTIRFCKKVGNRSQWLRLHYQRAWTYMYWYDDFTGFLEDLASFKKHINSDSNYVELEYYFNLINLLRGLVSSGHFDFEKSEFDPEKEMDEHLELLTIITKSELRLTSALVASNYLLIHRLFDSIKYNESSLDILKELRSNMALGSSYIDFPFDLFRALIEQHGPLFPDEQEYDNLYDTIAEISEKRSSELTAGSMFLKRASQKYLAGYHKESIKYFGKAVLKLSKEESQNEMYLSLTALASSYRILGLIWASNSCYTAALMISLKSWYQKGTISERALDCAKELSINELFIGRIPSFLAFHELYQVLYNQLNIYEEAPEGNIPDYQLIDGCLCVRLMNSSISEIDNTLVYLPDILKAQDLQLAEDVALYILGYGEDILKNYAGVNVKNKSELDKYFLRIAEQPFKGQMLWETNYMAKDGPVKLSAIILGCEFELLVQPVAELVLIAETILAYFESFLATSMKDIMPGTEKIRLEISQHEELNKVEFDNSESSSLYKIKIHKSFFLSQRDMNVKDEFFKFFIDVLTKNFMIPGSMEYFESLYTQEDVHERVALILKHHSFSKDVLGPQPKLFFSDWIKSESIKKYEVKEAPIQTIKTNKSPQSESIEETQQRTTEELFQDMGEGRHDVRKVFSVIDNYLWDKAKWRGFGFLLYPDYHGLGLFLGFEDGQIAKQIFKNWIGEFGSEDSKNKIRISILKGVSESNPNWYRVEVGSNMDIDNPANGDHFLTAARFHEMTPDNPKNLNNIIQFYNHFKRFRICPAEITRDGSKIEPYPKLFIEKSELIIRDAWEVGENDIDAVMILPGDKPIIPSHISDAPVHKLLKKRNSQ